MKRALIAALVVVILAGGFAALWQFGLPFVPAPVYEVAGAEYSSQHVLLRAYRAENGSDRWLLLGTSDGSARITVTAGKARGIYRTPGFSSISHNRPFEVVVSRRYLGFIYFPREKVLFRDLEQWPVYNKALDAQFKADLAAVR